MRKALIGLLVVVTALAVAGPASAATYRVWLGEQTRAPKGTPKGATLNQFFPRQIQIHAGDKVRFTSATFHTATYLGGQPGPPLALPDPTGTKYTAVEDFLNSPLWFNGLPKFLYNPQVFGAVGNTIIAGKAFHNSGVITANERGKPQGVTFSFPRAGSFKILCLVHPGMRATIDVKPKIAAAQRPGSVIARAKKDVARAWARAKALARTAVPANTVYAGVGGVPTTLLAFLPASKTIGVGETVTWVNKAPSEVHNVAFGESTWLKSFQDAHDLFPFRPDAPNQFFPIYVFGSEPPGAYAHNPDLHGNGFLATPVLDDQPGDPPNGLLGSFSVKFTTAGTFHYICQIHGVDMSGDIVVR